MSIRISTIDAYIIEVSDDWMTVVMVHQRVLDKIHSIHERGVSMPSLELTYKRLQVIAEADILEKKQIWGKYSGCYYMYRKKPQVSRRILKRERRGTATV
ncbi:hypothetical protein F4Z98_15665 [Candidatus Poribacteria bacterium]|nr:hypothetical protein [Candidatus Poribacteria bacterium]MYB01732.1 hypothetical protein [Candidatus Poribacteria bacterium]